MTVPLDRQIACVKREIAMREKVYRNWVATGKMKQDAATREINAMKAVLQTLLDVEAKQNPALELNRTEPR